MALVDVRGFNLDPQVVQRGMLGLQQGQQLGKQDRAAEIRGLLAQQGQQQQPVPGQDTTAQPQIPTQEDLIRQARQIDPEQAETILTQMGLDDATKRAEMSRFAAQLQTVPFAERGKAINARAQKLQSQGRDATETLKLLDITSEADQNNALTGIQLMDLSTKERLGLKAKQAVAASKRIEAKDVKSSKILDDSTVISVLKNNDVVVTGPTGEILEGEARLQAIRDAQDFGVDVQQRRSKGRELGKGAGKIALASFGAAGKIKENVLDLKRGIELIEKEGATTGYINDFLPNMKAATRKFANLRGKLGLNVVSSVTFGALSKGELNLAMDVALPKGMSEEETVNWIKTRVAAQEKLAANLEDAALYLADHSVAELIRRNIGMAKAAKNKEKKTELESLPETNAKGWGLMTDAQGNKAYVGPNGEIEEVK
jgi:hypothetical protein